MERQFGFISVHSLCHCLISSGRNIVKSDMLKRQLQYYMKGVFQAYYIHSYIYLYIYVHAYEDTGGHLCVLIYMCVYGKNIAGLI